MVKEVGDTGGLEVDPPQYEQPHAYFDKFSPKV